MARDLDARRSLGVQGLLVRTSIFDSNNSQLVVLNLPNTLNGYSSRPSAEVLEARDNS